MIDINYEFTYTFSLTFIKLTKKTDNYVVIMKDRYPVNENTNHLITAHIEKQGEKFVFVDEPGLNSMIARTIAYYIGFCEQIYYQANLDEKGVILDNLINDTIIKPKKSLRKSIYYYEQGIIKKIDDAIIDYIKSDFILDSDDKTERLISICINRDTKTRGSVLVWI